jgi:hypothetical protein
MLLDPGPTRREGIDPELINARVAVGPNPNLAATSDTFISASVTAVIGLHLEQGGDRNPHGTGQAHFARGGEHPLTPLSSGNRGQAETAQAGDIFQSEVGSQAPLLQAGGGSLFNGLQALSFRYNRSLRLDRRLYTGQDLW